MMPGVAPRPFYVTTPAGQLRIWHIGDDVQIIVLPGLINAAVTIAARLAANQPRLGAVVVELPGIGGSADIAPDSLDAITAAIGSAIQSLGLATAPILSLDGCAPIAASLLASRRDAPAPVLLNVQAARDWAAHDRKPPSLAPRADGTHLTALFAFLRDCHVLDPAAPWQAGRGGEALPDAQALNDAVVAAGWRPHGFAALWAACLGAMDLVPAEQEAKSWEDALRQIGTSRPGDRLRPPTERGTALRLGYVPTPGGLVHLRRAGPAGQHPVILLHSAPGSAAPLTYLIRALATDREVIAPDYLGNGESDKPDGPVDIAGLARDVLALADALGLGRFDLWGTHTGALIALEVALIAPQRVRRIIMEGPPLLSQESNSDILRNYFPPLEPHPWGLHLQSAWNMRRDMFFFWPWYRAERAAARPLGIPDADFLHDWTIGLLQSGRTYARSYRAAFEYDARTRLPHLARPSLICAAAADMLVGSLAAARAMALPLATIQATPATVWYPKQSPDVLLETIAIYRRVLDAAE